MSALLGSCFGMLIPLALVVVCLVSLWKVFIKAGREGWEGIVPIYNSYILWQLSGLEILWFILLFVPVVQIFAFYKIMCPLAEKFGKTNGFAIGLTLLSPIFLAILAFSDAKYAGGNAPAGNVPPVQPPTAPEA